MKTTRIILALIVALSALLSGCATSKIDLPDITAEEVYISHQNPFFNANIQADNLVDHGDHVTADRITYERGGRFTTTVIRVEGYRRDKKPADAAPAPQARPSRMRGNAPSAPAAPNGAAPTLPPKATGSEPVIQPSAPTSSNTAAETPGEDPTPTGASTSQPAELATPPPAGKPSTHVSHEQGA